jgi:hypothetical protein
MNTDTQIYIDKAIGEILNPTFDTTKQYLEVNEVEFVNGYPKIERVDLDYADDLIAVYFPVKNERYFLKIVLSKTHPIEAQFTDTESGHRTYFTATSYDLTFDELSQYLKLRPLKGWSKEEQKNKKPADRFSRISFEPFDSEAYELDKQLDILLTELEKDADNIIRLTKEAKAAYISVCKHQYVSGNAGIHFSIETINKLSKLNLCVDIDTYIVGNPIKEDDD